MQPGRIKLLEFITAFEVGGTERQVVNLARGLDPSIFELSFACLRRSGPFLEEIERLAVPLAEYNINTLRSRKALKEQIRFARYVKQSRIQIVHTYGFYAHVFAIAAARLAGVPIIVASVRDTGELWTPMQRRAQKVVCRWADCVLVNSEAVRHRLIEEGYSQDKIVVIGNGIDLAKFARNGSDGRMHREFILSGDAPRVVVLSRLHSMKGIDYFLEAAAMVATRFPEARFLIVGDGPYREELERYAVRLGLGQRVIFTGLRLDVPEVLSGVTVSVIPSLSEGLSNTLLESMAAGAPVVATKVGGNPEVVEDGVTGLLVPPRDPGALARAISLLLEDPPMALSLGRAGRQLVAERFSIERMVRQTENLYLRLMSRSPRRPAHTPTLGGVHAEPIV